MTARERRVGHLAECQDGVVAVLGEQGLEDVVGADRGAEQDHQRRGGRPHAALHQRDPDEQRAE